MSCPWLPPLNSHNSYRIIVSAYEQKNDEVKENISKFSSLGFSNTDPAVEFYVHGFVNFYPQINYHNKRLFQGLSIENSYGMLYSHLTSPQYFHHTVLNLIQNVLSSIPFGFEQVFFVEKFLDDDKSLLSPKKYTRIKNLNDLLVRIPGFVESVKTKPYNRDQNVFFLGLKIAKLVWIQEQEYEAWVNWYDEKKRFDPFFERNYMKAISRPRRYQEIVYDTTLTFRAASKSKLEEFLEEFLIDQIEMSCSICLDKIIIGDKGVRLPCSDAFHRDCITRWLLQSHVCPNCRFQVPTI